MKTNVSVAMAQVCKWIFMGLGISALVVMVQEKKEKEDL
jgi:hypothetical protein